MTTHFQRLLDRAASTDPDDRLDSGSPLEFAERFAVEIPLTVGGPSQYLVLIWHDAAAYRAGDEPSDGWYLYTGPRRAEDREVEYVQPGDAAVLWAALQRNPDEEIEPDEPEEEATYEVVRFYQGGQEAEVIETGLSLEEARAHCNDPETSSSTATSPEALERTQAKGAWFHGFREE